MTTAAAIEQIAINMLGRYSSPRVALEMAQLHRADYFPASEQWDHWTLVCEAIMRLARIDINGCPR